MRFAGRFAFAFGGEEGPVPATFANLGYETAGASPGDAASWVWTVGVADELIAVWGTGTPKADQEDFESEWSSNEDYLLAFDDETDLAAAFFDMTVSDGESIEDFEEGWGDDEHYHFTLPATTTAIFDSGSPEDVEDFEEEWDSNEDYDFTLGATTTASFDSGTPQDVEDFEDEWRGTGVGNDYDFTMGSTSTAAFDGGAPQSFEDFEQTFNSLQVSADPVTEKFTTGTGHGLSATNKVTFRLVGPGALPAGINDSFTYYVIAAGLTGTVFEVSTASGGTAVNITDAGAGTFYVRGDPALFWLLDP